MTVERRTDDRRRRVLFSSTQPHLANDQITSPDQQNNLRAARRPQEAYGSRVKRRLRARWFSLIPLHRSTLISVIAASFALVALLCAGHYYASTSEFLLNHSAIAVPLKVDQPNSFGHFAVLCLTGASAGIVLMIYQLRRYRSNDFSGHYRIWRLVLIVLAMTAVHSTVDLFNWGGAIIDAAMGRRIFISGENWIRTFLLVGGTALAVRLFLEVRAVIYAAIFLCVACGLFVTSEIASWQQWTVNSKWLWMVATCSTLTSVHALFLSFLIYLRKIYREVRQIDTIQKTSKLDSSQVNQEAASATDDLISDREGQTNRKHRQGGFAKRLLSISLFKTQKEKQASIKSESKQIKSEVVDSTEDPPVQSETVQKHHNNHQSDVSRSKVSASSSSNSTTVPQTGDSTGNEEIDWSSMSKSERRRLRKQLKRQKRAA